MNEIDFLPKNFRQSLDARQRVIREVALCAVVVAGMLAWTIHERGELKAEQQRVAIIEQQADAARHQVTEVARQRADRQVLRQQVLMQRKLIKPIGTAEILATFSSLVPDSVTFTEVTIVSDRPRPTQKVVKSQSRRPLSRVAPSQAAELIRMDLVGIAPGDGEIADLVGRLADHRLFDQVKLAYSRADQVDDLLARRFRIEMVIRMDREYRPTQQADRQPVRETEVADAS